MRDFTDSDGEDFAQVAARYRPELVAHCYRILGSVHDAEDSVQDVYLRAWRGYDAFEQRSSTRFWLYRIATHVCLSALEHKSRRLVPAGLMDPTRERDTAGTDGGQAWLEPFPEPVGGSEARDPADVAVSRDSLRLALIAALQFLPPRQRVVMIFRDVLCWRAAEVADVLGMSPAAVNAALQRARAQLARVSPSADRKAEPMSPAHNHLLHRYITAFENADIASLVALLREDAVFDMPPEPEFYAGRDQVAGYFASSVLRNPGTYKSVPVVANGQPAIATYAPSPGGDFRAHAIQVLGVSGHEVFAITAFRDPALFPVFGLPRQRTAASLGFLAPRA
ncbi:RNA polymerase subunit sigma-70 [Yinghuangia sp. ASG 101]|uniref:RNA polymerase subunit sigma-70 n=1 Tax=Yinghuangia sp. ASG 101 TaxID=2896848 RepID=UPI001E573416|nr:RNA polymerase subunit sigma-70 [Yinghuangia sp. ASG 101]UGQ11801.1 RNA polymerase subunit sigma-70 [Yinghuangia sp. ASG 101]